MNGRLYDAALGRMLSPDPIVQEPYNTQNLNRYTYVLNNPLSFTDPSGLNFIEKYWRTIVSIAINIFLPGAGLLASQFWNAVLTGFISGVVASGSLQGGLWGAFSAGVFAGIGAKFGGIAKANNGSGLDALGGLKPDQFAAKVLSHATTGGIMSTLQGGKFGHGFASAGVAQAFAPGIDQIGDGAANYAGARIVAAAMVGGTASVLSGGKFANGAITAAFARAFNDEDHLKDLSKDERIIVGRRVISESIAYSKRLDRLFESDPLAYATEVGFDSHGMSGDSVREALEIDHLVFRSEIYEMQGMAVSAIASGGMAKYFNGAAGPTSQVLGVLSATDGLMSKVKVALTTLGSAASVTDSASARQPIVVSCRYGQGCGWSFNND